MKIILIAAMNQRRVIGRAGGIPWHLPDDLKFFKRQTLGHAVIMGRKTFDSIGKPLPGRRNIVISRQSNSNPAAAIDVVPSLDAALALCRTRGETIAFVVGGAQIYALAMPLADEMLITHVDMPDVEGDTYFPEWNAVSWRDAGPADPAFSAAHRYVRIRR